MFYNHDYDIAAREEQISVFTAMKISDFRPGKFTSSLPSVYFFLNIFFGTNDEIFMYILVLGSRQAKSGLIQRYEKIMKHVAYVRKVLAS